MLTLFDINNVDGFSRYVLAGFIIYIVRNAYIVTDRPAMAEIALDILLLSTINQVVWWMVHQAAVALQSAAVAASVKPDHFAAFSMPPQAALVAETLLLPTLLGILLGAGLRKGRFRGMTRFIALPSVGPTKRAYDAVFSQITQPTYVVVALEDGSIIYGYFGDKSHAGRDPERSELYLEEIYRLDAAQDWQPFTPARSALINLAKMRSIEFINPQ